MVDIIGPADAQGAVTVRPGDTRSFGSADSWFVDCSTPTADDGTDVSAGFLNGIVAQLRNFWRSNGKLADGVTPVVAEAGNGDYGIVLAAQHMIQRSQLNYAPDTGSANSVVVALTPVLLEYKTGLVVRTKIAATNTGATVIAVNGLGAKPVVHPDGAALNARDLVAGAMAEFLYDGASFHLVGAQPNILTASRSYYVSNSGNDANVGDAAHPFATIQQAVNTVLGYNMNGYSVAIFVANGTYAGYYVPPLNGSGTLSIIGNVTTPSSCLVRSTMNSAVRVSARNVIIAGFKYMVDAVDGLGDIGAGIQIYQGGSLFLYNSDFGKCVGAWVCANTGSFCLFLGSPVDGSSNFINISGNSSLGFWCTTGAAMQFRGISLNILTAITVTSFATCNGGGTRGVLSPWTVSNAAGVTGPRYSVSGNGVLDAGGGGANYYPGSTAGSQSTGGQYLG